MIFKRTIFLIMKVMEVMEPMDIRIKACERQAFLLAHRLRNEKKN